MANYRPQSNKQSPDLLPYIIVFAILFFIALGVFTWFLDVFYRDHACSLFPNIWCSDNWTCNTNCTGGRGPMNLPVSPCFTSVGVTGLASCLYGPDAPGATVCLKAPKIGPTAGGTGLSCDCPTGMSSTGGTIISNCFNQCAINLESIGQPTCCCNDPNNHNCLVNRSGIGQGQCAPTS